MFNLQPFGKATYLLPKQGQMRVPGLIIATEKLLQELEIEKPLTQVYNVAHLPGIQGYSIAMPDVHWGYGFPIGGVAATDLQEGVISPGGVGYDINCGVRLAVIPLAFNELSPAKRTDLIKELFKHIPSGVGHGHKRKGLTQGDYRNLLNLGAAWSVQEGFGFEEDLHHCESRGVISGAELEAVSEQAQQRGQNQLGSVGSGNHFVEVGEVQQIFLPEIANAWGIQKGQTYVLIHSGSRGFGHQVCQDYLDQFISQGYAKGLPDKQLVAAPTQSEAGKLYFSAMAAAANFAFNNRQQLLHLVRESFYKVLKTDPQEIRLIYDVCHNIAKIEEHVVEGVFKQLCVHRKGATRAFGPGASELTPLYRKTGQPVLVPGDMGRASYLLVGTGNPLTFASCCHGAGRASSRIQSFKKWSGRNPVETMYQQGVQVFATDSRTIAEEMPDAYKNVDDVVAAVQEANLANPVARLKPHLVVKG